MLKSIKLKFTDCADIDLPLTGITIFVGPNNSGKSLVLKELESVLGAQNFPMNLNILRDFEVEWLEFDSLETKLKKFSSLGDAADPNSLKIARINPNGGREVGSIHVPSARRNLEHKSAKQWWAHSFVKWGMIRLDGRSRFNLTNDQSAGDLLAEPINVFSHLYQSDTARRKVRELVEEAFGLTFVIDPTNLGSLRLRLATAPFAGDEQSLSAAAREYYRNATYIKDASDGVQAYVGIVTALMSGEFHTITIDEPEAFLHPPLARKLGKQLGRTVVEQESALLASTHSPDFLMGCVHATKDVRVVRLEFNNGRSRGRVVDPTELETFFKRPLMRSANVVSGLFHDGVIVTESENDRAFYAEIYYRLTQVHADFPSVLIIHAQNKQTIRDIIGPLRKFGVPAVAIPDIDIIKDGGQNWTAWMNAAHVPQPLQAGYANQRQAICKVFDDHRLDMHKGGVELLQGGERQAAETLFDTLAEYGIFAVKKGEVEQWLAHLNVEGKKTTWTVNMLERLGSDPRDQSYVQPEQDDVWEFMHTIITWMKDPVRKGLPL